jgi:hypothetical protein
MVALSLSSSKSRASLGSSSHQSLKQAALVALSGASTPSSSASSSKVSLDLDEGDLHHSPHSRVIHHILLENVTITANRTAKRHGKQKSQECVAALPYWRILAHIDNISQGSAPTSRLYPYDGALL